MSKIEDKLDNVVYIYVLDYCDYTICEITVDADFEEDMEDLLKQYGVDIDTCSFMISTEKIDNIIHLEKDDGTSE